MWDVIHIITWTPFDKFAPTYYVVWLRMEALKIGAVYMPTGKEVQYAREGGLL